MYVFCTPSPAAASAWNIIKGEFLVISRAEYFDSDLGLISVMDEPTSARFQRVESTTFVEFGVSDRIIVGGKAYYGNSFLTRGDAVETNAGFTEVEAFAQTQVFRNPRHAGAIKVAVGKPSDAINSGVRQSLSSRGVDVELTALYGRSLSFEPVKIFANAEFGIRKRFSDSADQIRLLTTVGIEPLKRWTVLIDTYSIKSFENEIADGADYDIVKLQPSLVWQYGKRSALQIGLSEEIAGRNIDLGRTLFVGVWSRF